MSFPSHEQKFLSVEIQHKVVYSITGGKYNVLRQWGESSCAVLSVAFYPSSRKHLYEGSLVPGLGKDIRPVQRVSALLPLTYFLCSHEEVRDRTYYTRYFIAFAGDIFSVW